MFLTDEERKVLESFRSPRNIEPTDNAEQVYSLARRGYMHLGFYDDFRDREFAETARLTELAERILSYREPKDGLFTRFLVRLVNAF